MSKKILTVVLTLAIGTIPLRTCALDSDFKVNAMGEMDLITTDPDHQLNLYDFGRNPAWMVQDQQRNWWRSFVITDIRQGNFKRRYDPRNSYDMHGFFEGIKIMDAHQTFRGRVDYHDLNLTHVERAINRDPYAEHPFRLADSTIGNIHYWGPKVSAEYSRHISGNNLFGGAALSYQIETGLKDFFPQPRTIYRCMTASTGLAYRISDPIIVGISLDYSNTQEVAECISSDSNDPRSIKIIKFRGDTAATTHLGDIERFLNSRAVRWRFQSHLCLSRYLETALLCCFTFETLKATESRSQPVKDGTWNLHGYEIHGKSHLRFPNSPFRLGLAYDRIYFNDWALHPDFDVVLGDDFLMENRIGLGLAYEPEVLPLILGMEYYFSLAEKDKHDYISRMFGSGEIDQRLLRVGAECEILKNLKVRAGYIFHSYAIDQSLLSFSEFVSSNTCQRLTFGLGYLMASVDTEFYGYYGQQKPIEPDTPFRRKQLGLMFLIKFNRD